MTNECRDVGSLYMPREGLTEFPTNADCSHTINLNSNNITSLKNANASKCETLDVSNNQIRNLTADFHQGFPNLVFLNARGNPIGYLDGGILTGLSGIILSNTLLDYFPWDDAHEDLQVWLANVTLRCGCAMKRAIKRGVVIKSPPTCASGKPYKESIDELQCREINGKMFTARIRKMEEGTVFSLSVHSWGGYPLPVLVIC